MARQPVRIYVDAGPQADADGVVLLLSKWPNAVLHALNGIRAANDPFGEKETRCQVNVMTRGTHGDGDWDGLAPTGVQPDLQRLLSCERVLLHTHILLAILQANFPDAPPDGCAGTLIGADALHRRETAGPLGVTDSFTVTGSIVTMAL